MKRFTFIFALLLATTTMMAKKFTLGKLKFETLSDTEVELVGADKGITNIYLNSPITYQGKSYSVTSIGDYAFEDCSGLTSITIPNSVTSIGMWAFWGCSTLTSITIPNSVTSIGVEAFAYCYGLTSITIPNGVKEIGEMAFSGCYRLTSITIPNSVTSIGYAAFYNCAALTSITIPNSVTSIGWGAFWGTALCNNKSNWKNGALYINDCLIEVSDDIVGNFKIKESTRLIADRAFRGCSGLTSITIPNSVTSIGYAAFEGTAFYNNPSNWNKGALYLSDCLIRLTDGYVGDYKIKESTRLIAHGAFKGCTGLTSITIPESVTSIDEWAFKDCTGLTSATLPSHTTIAENAFPEHTQIIRK